jgi:hypothetical protein
MPITKATLATPPHKPFQTSVPAAEQHVPRGELNVAKPLNHLEDGGQCQTNNKKRAMPLLAICCAALVLGSLQISLTIAQTYPQLTPQTTPAVSQEQAVQLALQEAQTLNLTPFFGGGPIVHQVDPLPSNVTFYSFGVYPKWLITFNVMFFWPMGHCPGFIKVQVAADTGKIDNTNVTEAPTNESTPTALPSQNPMVTPSPTPTITPTPTPTKSPEPTQTATPQPKENSSNYEVTLILVAALVVLIAGATPAFRFRRTKQSE